MPEAYTLVSLKQGNKNIITSLLPNSLASKSFLYFPFSPRVILTFSRRHPTKQTGQKVLFNEEWCVRERERYKRWT